MKKSLKIFAASLAVTTALLSFAFIASADDAQATDAPEIVSTNIAYEGNYGMIIAVDAATVTGDSVTVKVWEKGADEATAETYTATEAKADAYIGNSTYFVVHTNAIAQKDMDKVFCYKAVDGTNEGAVMEYSVAEYFFDRLFICDIINATEADDIKRKNLYIATLNQGALAQDVLYNCDNDDTNDKAVLVNELNFYADFVNKTTEIYDNDTTQVTLAGDAATKYTVTKYDADFNATSETVVGGTAVVVDAHTVVTEYKFAFGNGKYFNNAGLYTSGTKYDFTDITVIDANTWQHKNVTRNDDTLIGTEKAHVRVNADGQYEISGCQDKDGATNSYGVTIVNTGILTDVTNPNHVFESDMCFSATTVTGTPDSNGRIEIGYIGLTAGEWNQLGTTYDFLRFTVWAVVDANNAVTGFVIDSEGDKIEIEVGNGEWFNIGFEVYDAADTTEDDNYQTQDVRYNAYVNGQLVDSGLRFACNGSKTNNDNYKGFNYSAKSVESIGFSLKLDNIYMGSYDPAAQ